MRIGPLRHMATVQKHADTKDGAGGITKSWTDVVQMWCDIKPLTGKEKFVSHEKHATATHQIITRYVSGISPKMRIASRGRIFEIVSVINVNERDKMLQIIVEEDADHD